MINIIQKSTIIYFNTFFHLKSEKLHKIKWVHINAREINTGNLYKMFNNFKFIKE